MEEVVQGARGGGSDGAGLAEQPFDLALRIWSAHRDLVRGRLHWLLLRQDAGLPALVLSLYDDPQLCTEGAGVTEVLMRMPPQADLVPGWSGAWARTRRGTASACSSPGR